MKNLQTLIINLFAILIFGAGAANAATWTVTKAANSNDNVCDTDCSLREAVFNADSGDTVAFSSNLVGQTITLGGSEIVITKRITIDGYLNNPNVAFISGNNTSRIFYIETGAGLALKNMILVQGSGESSPGNPGNNVIAPSGGAIIAFSGSALSLDRVSARGNTAKFGGAIHLGSGTHHITNSSLTSNSAESGTAISQVNGGSLFMSNTTVSGNYLSADNQQTVGCGAICTRSVRLTIRNSTIVNNSAKIGGGIGVIGSGSPTPDNILNIGNTIVAGNTATLFGQDIRHTNGADMELTSLGGNLIQNLDTIPDGTFNKPKDITGVNPLLAPINSNQGGFPVQTHPLQAGSPARNGGLNQNAVDPLTNQPLTTDARGAGFPRIADGTVDIGAFEDQSGNTSLVVTKKTNSNDLVCDVDCSLREAVHQASLNFGTDTITFAPNVFGTLELGGTEILIQNQNVNIVGYPNLNANTLIVSGANVNRVFHLNNATVKLSGMTVANGNAGAGFGGGILAENGSNLTLDQTIVRNNFATAYGAVYLSGGTGHFTNSTINNNSANTGLALAVSGTLNMANTTVSSNFDADGGTGIGAIYVTGTANIRNSTIAFNRTSGGTGGGIFNAGTLNIGNSIVANNIAAVSPDIHLSSGTITSVGGNLVQNTSGFPAGTFTQTNDQTGVDPLLAALDDNGGNVTTHSLMPNSPAINTGLNANAVDPFDNSVLTTDARGTGFSRIIGAAVDKGAFEALAPTAAGVTVSGRVISGKRGIALANVYLTDQNGVTRTSTTDSFGYYSFEDVQAGGTYIFNVLSKGYLFTPQVIIVTEQTDELNFVLSYKGKSGF
jgi:hypothetical protein